PRRAAPRLTVSEDARRPENSVYSRPLHLPMSRGMEPATELEFLPIFRDEASARLDTFVATLRELDPGVPDAGAMDLLRREAHTIKGAAGMVGLTRAHRLAHALEDVCRYAQEDGGALGADLVEILFRAAEALRAAIEREDEPTGHAHLHAVP